MTDETSWGEQRSRLINGIHINYMRAGHGPPVLLLHGFPDSLQLWRKIAPSLVANGSDVIAFDQRGYGQSDAPPAVSAYKLSIILKDARDLLQSLGITDKVRVIGHDWGAVVAWLLACNHPELFDRVAAISVGHPLAYRNAGLEQKLKSWYLGLFSLTSLTEAVFMWNDWQLLRMMTEAHPETERWISDLKRPGRLTAALNWYRANLISLIGEQFPRCKIPALGIYGPDIALSEDQMINSSRYVDARWQYKRLEGCTHWIPLDKPTELSEILVQWLQTENL